MFSFNRLLTFTAFNMMNSCFLVFYRNVNGKSCCLCGTEIISSWKASTLGMNCGCIHQIPSLWLVEIWFFVVYRDLMKFSPAHQSSVNIHRAKRVGLAILKKMEGQLENNWTFKRKEQAVCLGAKVNMKNGTLIQMDSQNLFDRLIVLVLMMSLENRTG